jgi:hypothetical protein
VARPPGHDGPGASGAERPHGDAAARLVHRLEYSHPKAEPTLGKGDRAARPFHVSSEFAAQPANQCRGGPEENERPANQ